jgi:hypothetical protein
MYSEKLGLLIGKAIRYAIIAAAVVFLSGKVGGSGSGSKPSNPGSSPSAPNPSSSPSSS